MWNSFQAVLGLERGFKSDLGYKKIDSQTTHKKNDWGNIKQDKVKKSLTASIRMIKKEE